MSIKAMVWAWSQPDVASTELLVLLALADHANDEGLCWPGQEGLADKCRVTRETVNRTIKNLEVKGKLEIIRRADEHGRPMANQYRLCVKQGGNVTQDHTLCDFKSQGYVTQDHTNLNSESSIETSEEKGADAPPPLAVQEIIEGWNEVVAPLGLPKVLGLSSEREAKLRARIREHPDVEWWQAIFNRIAKSKFLRGENDRGWVCTLDFLIKNDGNALKIYEGQYERTGKEKYAQAVR